MVTCRTNADCRQDLKDYGKSFAITGRFILDEESHFRYKIVDARVEGPVVICWDDSIAESLSKCPVYPEIELSINGIGVGSSFAEVIRSLGKPSKMVANSHDSYDDCAELWHRTLIYDGLTVNLIGEGKDVNFSVIGFEVTAPKWNVSGLRIGDSSSRVLERFGKPMLDADMHGEQSFRYVTPGNEGWVGISFSRLGLINSFRVSMTLC